MLVALGQNNAEIAVQLAIHVDTVKGDASADHGDDLVLDLLSDEQRACDAGSGQERRSPSGSQRFQREASTSANSSGPVGRPRMPRLNMAVIAAAKSMGPKWGGPDQVLQSVQSDATCLG